MDEALSIYQHNRMSVCLSIFSAILNLAFSFIRLEIRWQIIEKFDPYTFLKAWDVSSWFMEVVLVSFINTVYICIDMKMFFVICNEVY
jgi:sterol desaturase/sphingolipid hydroxylase (fatty acid hydroxylase superfamily)